MYSNLKLKLEFGQTGGIVSASTATKIKIPKRHFRAMQGSSMFSAEHFPKLTSNVLFSAENLLYFLVLKIQIVLENCQNFSLHPHFTKRLKCSNFLIHEILQAVLVQIDPLWSAAREFYPSAAFLCSQKHGKSPEIHTHPHLHWLTGNYLLYFDFIFRMDQYKKIHCDTVSSAKILNHIC